MKKYLISVFIGIIGFLFITTRVFASPFAYVPSEGSDSTPGQISVIDVADNYNLLSPITDGQGGQTIAITPDQTKALIANRFTNTVYIIDTANGSLISSIPVSNEGEIVITPDGQKAYVASYVATEDNPVKILNLVSNTVTGSISSVGAFGLALSPDGTKLYGGNSVIDVATDTIQATIPVKITDSAVVSQTGNKLYIPAFFENLVYVLDTSTNQVTNAIPVGQGPWGIAITPSGDKLYVANFDSNSVSVINTSSEKVIATINFGAGKDPITIKVAPDGQIAFVLNSTGQTPEVAVIDVQSDVLTRTISLPNIWWAYSLGIFDRGFTKSGLNTTIYPSSNTTLIFSEVSSSGNTSVTVLSSPPALPEGFQIGDAYFDITSTVSFTGLVTVCVSYSDTIINESNLKILHEEGGIWVDRTTSLDTDNNIICGQVASFSNFAVVIEPTISDLINKVKGLNLQQGIQNSLDAKLESVLNAKKNNNITASVNKLQAFVNEVEAQRGNKLTQTQADELHSFSDNLIKIVQGINQF